MKEVERLSAAVARLGEAPERRTRHGRILAAADPQGLVEAVLGEIDETVLGRELQFRNDRAEEISLEVSGRRLLRMSGVAPEDLAATCEGTIGTPVVDADGAASLAVAGVLWAMAQGSEAFTVASRKLSHRTEPAEVGCSAEALLAAWKRHGPARAGAQPPDLAEFAARILQTATALVRLEDGKILQQEGAEEAVGRLVQLFRTEAPAGGGSSPGGGGAGMVLLSAGGEGDAILCARDGTQAVLAQFPARLTAAVIARWLGPA